MKQLDTPSLFEQNTSAIEQASPLHPAAHTPSPPVPATQAEEQEGSAEKKASNGMPSAAQDEPRPTHSAFESSTIELVLQLLPDDHHAEGRRVRQIGRESCRETV